jgi:hypothetical protein
MANKRFIDFPIATTVGDNDIILIWQSGANKQTTKATILSGVPDSLNDLTDVTISGLTNGQILRYDSVSGQWENTDQGNLDLNDLNDVTIVSPTNGQVLVYNSSTSKWENSSGGYVPYVGAVTTVNLGAQTIQAGSFVKQGGTSSQFLKANGSVDSTAYGTGSVTSVGLTMPSAFNVANSPITTAGTLAVTGAGTVAQYIRGDGSLADFPESSGGGSSVSYYLNGSVAQGTIGGIAYNELSKVPILGAGTDFTINADGYIASFITDAGDPNLLEIPGGNWNFETYFSASSGGGSPTFYVELYKVNAGGTATLIASSSTSPELIAFGTNLTPYFSSLAVPTTTLAFTDRLAIRYYVTHSGRTITLHTENNTLCQIITTFTTGLTALNGLTAQVQNFAVGTTGTDFNIASAVSTHTFNLPTASATNRGALSSADWALFTQAYNDKINSAAVTGTTTKTLTLTQQDGGTITASWSDLNTDAVLSVFGRTGNVIAVSGDYTTAQVTESGNLYYTDARSRAALSFAAGSGAYNPSTGVITIPTNNNQITNGAGYITSAALAGYLPLTGGTLTGPLNGTTASFSGSVTVSTNNATGGGIILADDGDIVDLNDGYASMRFSLGVRIFSANRGGSPVITLANTGAISANGNITGANLSGTNTGDVTIGTANGLSLSGQALSLGLSSGSANGALSSSDWTTFNNKANANGSNASGTWGINITGNSTAVVNTVTGTNSAELVRGNMADNDQFRILVGGNASNAGFAEIATADDGTEPIYVRQYTGVFTSLVRSATLLDGSGNTSFPGSLTAGALSQIGNVFIGGRSGTYAVYSDGIFGDNLHLGATAAAGAVYINSALSRQLFINPVGGNVLIGTTTDNGARLQVSGEGRFYQPLTSTTSYLTVENNRSRNAAIRLKTTVGDFYLGVGIGADVNQFQIYDGTAGANRLTINSTGAATFSSIVGVNGATEAGWALKSNGNLKVENNNGTTVLQVADTASGGKTWSLISSGSGNVHSVPAGTFYLRNSSDGLTALSVTSAGNVGIGTSTVFSPLHLNANGNYSSSGNMTTGFVISNSTTGRALNLGTFDSGGYSWIQAAYVNSADITFSLALQPRGGNVGIGTTSSLNYPLLVQSNNTGNSICLIGRSVDNASSIDFFNSTSTTALMEILVDSVSADINYLVDNAPMKFFTYSVPRMTISGGGNVGIGTENPNYSLNIVNSGASTFLGISNQGVSTGNRQLRLGFGGAGADTFASIQGTRLNVADDVNIAIQAGGGNVLIGTTSDNTAKLQVNGGATFAGTCALSDNQLRVRGLTDQNHAIVYNGTINGPLSYGYFGSGLGYTEGGAANITLMTYKGNVYIGTTTTIGPAAGKLDILYSGLTQYGMNIRSSHTDGIAISFVNSSGTQVGTIYQNGSSTAYNTSSDYRLKEDLKEFNGIDLINKIKTYDFKWKSDNSRSYGVVAHELQEVINYAVFGQKDSLTMQGVDYSKLVPILIKAIQEQQVQIDKLKN